MKATNTAHVTITKTKIWGEGSPLPSNENKISRCWREWSPRERCDMDGTPERVSIGKMRINTASWEAAE